ncbi:MAG: hypothetical protein KF883_15985 [Thermomicrobiales bacterium]|nr:hypothetical protein [Thermomicrobiales bacterium]
MSEIVQSRPSRPRGHQWIGVCFAAFVCFLLAASSSEAQESGAGLVIQAWECPFDYQGADYSGDCAIPLADLRVGIPGMSEIEFMATDQTGVAGSTIPSGDVLLRVKWPSSEYDGAATYSPIVNCVSESGVVTTQIPDGGYDGWLVELIGVQPDDSVTCQYFSRYLAREEGIASVDGSGTETIAELPNTGAGGAGYASNQVLAGAGSAMPHSSIPVLFAVMGLLSLIAFWMAGMIREKH